MTIKKSISTIILQRLTLIVMSAFLVVSSLATQFYVSPTGVPTNPGTITSPWDLQTALNQPISVKPGDTIWVRGGIYTHAPQGATISPQQQGWIFWSKLVGTAASPIIVRGYPGERAIIDGGAWVYQNATGRPTIDIQGAYTWYWDLEIVSLSTEARFSPDDSSFPSSVNRSDGPNVFGKSIKLINCVVHDLAAGISAWGQAGDFEAYGNIGYNNGWQGTPHAHGHNVYTQNYVSSLPKFYLDNIFLNAFQFNSQAYGSSKAEVAHMRFYNNTFFNSNELIGGRTDTELRDNQFNDNYLYNSEAALAYMAGTNYWDVTATGNYVVEGRIQIGFWKNVTFNNNTIISVVYGSLTDVVLATPPGSPLNPAWKWDNNIYMAYDPAMPNNINTSNFPIEGEGWYKLAAWRTRSGYDLNSSYKNILPAANNIILRPNKYDNNRANLTIYNWQNQSTITIDTSALNAKGWVSGDNVEVHNVQDYYKDVVTGVYNGNSIIVNMAKSAHTVALPLGWNTALGPNTFPAFGAFVLIKKIGGVIVNNFPIVTITSPVNGTSFVPPASIVVNTIATDTDGTISKVELFNGTTLIGTDTSLPYSFTWNNVTAGNYTLTAKATDNIGAATVSSPINVIVSNPNISPVVSITSPLNGITFSTPVDVVINSAATDSDGTISKVELFSGTTLLNTDTTSPYSFTWLNVPAGSYTLISKATDNSGAVSTSSPVNIVVSTTSTNQPPVVSISSPANGASFLEPATITINSSATDSDGTISKIDVFAGTKLIGSSTSSPYSFTWTTAIEGNYMLIAKATDNSGAVSTSPIVNISISQPTNQPPTISISSPANGATFVSPTNININSTWNNAVPGIYTLTAEATDSTGVKTKSNPITVTVTPAVNPTTNTTFVTTTILGSIRNDFDGWLGLKFTVGSSPIKVTSLGRYVISGNAGTHTVKLVNASNGSDILNGSVSVSLSGATSGQFKYVALSSPVNLLANTAYYLVSQEIAGGDKWATEATTITTSTGATCNGAVLSNSGTWNIRLPANISFVPVSFTY